MKAEQSSKRGSQLVRRISIPSILLLLLIQILSQRNGQSFDLSVYEKVIDAYPIISFDMFDTLLVRPYVRPSDLFLHLEKLTALSGFQAARIHAESRARETQAEITLEDIYSLLPSKFQCVKQMEMEMEKQVLTVNPDIKCIYDYALKKQKTIIIVSDMYLPKALLEVILKEKGYSSFTKLYVSSEYKMTKHSGALFKYILKDLKTKGGNVLHIGDNPIADRDRPQQYGINTILIKKRMEGLLERSHRARIFLKSHEHDLGASILLGLISVESWQHDDNYWHKIGFTHGGPVVLGFMQWLDEKLRDNDMITDVLFVARDGYTLKTIYQLIQSSKKRIHYVFAPRKLAVTVNFDYKCPGCARFFIDRFRNRSQFLISNTPNSSSIQDALDFIRNNEEHYQHFVAEEIRNYKQYLQTILDGREDHIAVVDTVGWNLSALRAITRAVGKKNITGYYWYASNRSDLQQYQRETYQDEQKWYFTNWGIMEFFMTAPTPTADRIENGSVILQSWTNEEYGRLKYYPDITYGEQLFTYQYLRIFGRVPIFFSWRLLTDWINLFSENPTSADIKHLSSLQHAADPGHKDYKPLMENWKNKYL